jgi:hypothetical protein
MCFSIILEMLVAFLLLFFLELMFLQLLLLFVQVCNYHINNSLMDSDDLQ